MPKKKQKEANNLIDSVSAEATKFIAATADIADEKVQAARTRLSGVVSQWSDGVEGAIDQVKDTGEETLEYLRNDPIRAVGIGLGVGFLIGFFLGRR